MAKNHILRVNAEGQPVGLYHYDAQSNSCQSTQVSQWSDQVLKKPGLTVLVPAQWVYQTQTQVASKNEELLKKSIPFAVEEELSNELEDNFFAFRQNQDGTQQVVAIHKSPLKQLHQDITDQQLDVRHIYSEHAWIPGTEDTTHVWQEGDSSLVRFGLNQAMVVPTEQLEQLIPVFATEHKKVITNQAIVLPGYQVEESLTETIYARHVVDVDHLGLWVDELQKENTENKQSSWRLVGWLTLALLSSWLGIRLYQLNQLHNQIETIKQQQQHILIQAFPDAAAVELNDPYAALNSRLQLASGQNNQSSTILLDAVHGIGQVFQQQQQIQLKGLRLSNGVLEIQIAAPTMSSINQFHQALQATTPAYRVLIGVNELGDDNVFKSILTMEAR